MSSCSGPRTVAGKRSEVYKPLSNRELTNKYADLLHVRRSQLHNLKLYAFVDEWLRVPYRWGGNDKLGVDCSGFVNQLYAKVYGTPIQRTVAKLYASEKRLYKESKLKEGDLVYFKENNKPVHVGVYLHNGYFVHSSESKGVHISHLEDAYWKQTFVGGGRSERR